MVFDFLARPKELLMGIVNSLFSNGRLNSLLSNTMDIATIPSVCGTLVLSVQLFYFDNWHVEKIRLSKQVIVTNVLKKWINKTKTYFARNFDYLTHKSILRISSGLPHHLVNLKVVLLYLTRLMKTEEGIANVNAKKMSWRIYPIWT